MLLIYILPCPPFIPLLKCPCGVWMYVWGGEGGGHVPVSVYLLLTAHLLAQTAQSSSTKVLGLLLASKAHLGYTAMR